jgi:hypothetical protein
MNKQSYICLFILVLTIFASYQLGRNHKINEYETMLFERDVITTNYAVKLDSMQLHLIKSVRLVNAQRRFFHRIVEGKYEYLPAVDACKMCLLGFENMSVYVPDSFRNKKPIRTKWECK